MNELLKILEDDGLNEHTKLIMLTAQKLFVEPDNTLDDMTALFLGFVGIIAEEHPERISLYLKALSAAQLNKKLRHPLL